MTIGPACEAAKVLGHSWPGIRWWLSLTAADQGAWVSGFGALIASIISLFVAFLPRRWRAVDRREKARLISKLIVRELYLARAGSYVLLKDLKPYRDGDDVIGAAEAIRGFNLSAAPMIDRFLDQLDYFEGRHFSQIASGIVSMKNVEKDVAQLRQVASISGIADATYLLVRRSAVKSICATVGEAAVALQEAISACEKYGATSSIEP